MCGGDAAFCQITLTTCCLLGSQTELDPYTFGGSYHHRRLQFTTLLYLIRMWANAKRDGRPAKCRWRPLSTPQFGWRPLLECRAVTLPRRVRWNLQGCPKLRNWSQPSVGWSSPYYEDRWRRYCCLASFFPIVDICLRCEDTVQQIVRWCRDGDFLGRFCVLSSEL